MGDVVRKSRAKWIEFQCPECSRDSKVQMKRWGQRPRKVCDTCFYTHECLLCSEKIYYENPIEWRRAKGKERLRKHEDCKVERRVEKERARRDRILLLSDVDRLEGIEKELHKGWAKRVKERDGMRCVACGTGEGEMHAHHVRPVHRYPYLSTHIPNGVTLCRECHVGVGGVHGGGEAGSEVVQELRERG